MSFDKKTMSFDKKTDIYIDSGWILQMEELRESSKLLHPEVLSVTRQSVEESQKGKRVTLPYYSKYEYTALLGTRAQQLAEGAKPLVSLEGLIASAPDFPVNLAKKEILEQKLPFIIHRRLPNGISEYWSTMELSIIW
jgi:DNA-directed RNA polymerase I, II, and III subunit RPABC2